MYKFAKLFIWAISVLAFASIGCNGELPPHGKQLLLSANQAYLTGEDAKAIEYADTFLRDFYRTRYAGEAYYLRGLSRYRRKELKTAQQDFLLAVEKTEDDHLRGNAYKAMGDLAFESGDMALAQSSYVGALDNLELQRAPADQVHYRFGQVLQRQGQWAQADTQFNRLIDLFAGGDYAALAEKRVHSSVWTIQAGVFSRKDRAGSATEKLRTLRLPATQQATMINGQLRFVVTVGRYLTYEQAIAALPEVKKHQKDAFVTTTR